MILGRRGYSVVGGKYGAPRLIPLHRWRWPALVLCMLILLNPVFLPYAALFNAAFSPVASTFLTVQNFTLHNINFVLFELSAASLALKNTVGLFLSYTRPPFVLYGTLWILLIAFVTIALPSSYQQLQAAFRTIHPELEDASRILGATRLRSLWEITAPLLRTGVIATWCFIFVGVMRELSAAIILFTSETKVVSVLIYDLNESGDLGAISVIGLGMLLITFAVVIAVNRIPGFGNVRFRT
jgi:iron(III) transport system permease protein